MTLAEQVLVLSAVALLIGGSVTGIFMSQVRTTEPEVPKYLRFAHLAGYMQAPILLGIVIALQFSGMSTGFDNATAIVMSAGAVLLFAKDVVNWRMETADEFREKGLGYQLGAVSGLTQFAGLVMVAIAVVSGL